ncbi:iron-containing alcohol dehydrogenase [Planctobacterium marinum]|uniref:iron-containing alcohol dehydrogenase n=2 Tax=Planctobacterium marinum TaxID=1631968 RepID=UPI001E4C63B2|nr:iron-containing alcohol dehydrogenase [Planctobacterium marinum]
MPFAVRVLLYKFVMVMLKLVTVFIPAPKPTIYSGAGSSLKLCESLNYMGVNRLLIVTDEMLVKLGLLEPIEQRLKALNIEFVVFDKVVPDPGYQIVEAGVDLGVTHKCDAVLGFGGGSSLDAAKIIAARLTNPVPIKKLVGVLKVKVAPVPIFTIPTTAGTGSETTIAAVVSDPDTNQKTPVIDPKLVPVAAALDPVLMTGLPPQITAATGMDALTHAVESYISRHAAPDTDVYALSAVKMIMKYLPVAYKDGNNLEAREAMALASFYAGAAFTKANLGYVHAIAHQFGAFYHTPHGLANAIVLPKVLDYSLPAATERLAQLAVATGLGDHSEAEPVLAQKFVDSVKALNQQIGIPSTLDKLKQEDIPAIAKGALKEAHYLYPVPRYMNNKQCQAMVSAMLAS